MKKTKQLLCLILTLALTFSMSFSNVAQAKKKAPKLNKKKVTLTVGKTVTLKVKNTKKKVKWSTSKKSVATVSKKGKVKAKKKGTATITAKVAGKKLKCKVTVKKKATTKKNTKKETNTVVSTPAPTPVVTNPNTTVAPPIETGNSIASVTIVTDTIINVTLAKPQKLTDDNFSLLVKKHPNGEYFDSSDLEISGITTNDQITYTLLLDSYDNYLLLGETVKITVSGLEGTGTASIETIYKQNTLLTSTRNVTATVGSSFGTSTSWDGYGYKSILSSELPDGIRISSTYEDNFYFSGTPTEAGVFVGDIVYKDEFNNVYTITVTWVIGSADTIVADCAPSYSMYTDQAIKSTRTFYVKGGSGSYTYNVPDTITGASITITESSKKLSGTFEAAGTYHIPVEVIDANNADLKTTFTWTVNIEAAKHITIKPVDANGNAIDSGYFSFYFTNQNQNASYSTSTSTSGYAEKTTLSVNLADGTYDILYYYNDTMKYLPGGCIVSGEDATLEIQLPIYKVNVSLINYNISDLTWYDEDNIEVGYGDTVYLPAGTHSIHAMIAGDKPLTSIRFDAEVSINTLGDNSVLATPSEVSRVKGPITLGVPIELTMEELSIGYSFVPEESGTYNFYTESNSDSYGYLYDSDFSRLTANDDDGEGTNFLITYDCEAGQTYYITVLPYYTSDTGEKVTLKVEKAETTVTE